MNLLRINQLDYNFKINPGIIYLINFENRELYFKIIKDLLEENYETFTYSELNNLFDLGKKSVFVPSIFTIDINNRKILTSLYKKIDKNIVTESEKREIDLINGQILNIFNNIELELNGSFDYEDSLDISKLLSLYKFSYADDDTDYIVRFINYIKAYISLLDIKIVFTLSLLKYLDEKDIQILKKEFELLKITLIDIDYLSNYKNENIEKITIDRDLCLF